MASQRDITRARVAQLIDRVVKPAIHPARAALAVHAAHLPGEPVSPSEAYALAFEPFRVGDPWGGAWGTTWFRLEAKVPDEWAGAEVVALIDLGYRGMVGFGGEGLLWDQESPLGGINPRHRDHVVARPARGGEQVLLHLEAAANPAGPMGQLEWPLLMPDYDGTPLYRLARAELAVVRRDVEAAYHDLRVLAELSEALGPDDPRSSLLLHTLDRVCSAVDIGDVATTVLAARPLWAAAMESPAGPNAHVISAVGHAHIDTAWLWPLRETVRKCARTFSTAVGLMDEYPDFRFVCSQAQQHAWMKERYPSLFARMQDKAKSGQFEPAGSMWVEPDVNLPSGESLVRQLVFGKRFFLEEYGIETTELWLPDAFGYSGALPQILREAGVSYFVTQKMSWNELNRFPHHSFWWEGIDGSRVLAHFPPADTYNGDFSVRQVIAGSERFAQHTLSRHSLYPYGYGDGGGGPTRQMIESAHRLADIEGSPRVQLDTVRDFFAKVEAESSSLPVWVGELYLEKHRGVYTTQAASKLGNRRSEDLLREAEMWSVAAHPNIDYPTAEIDAAWRLVLLHQFHDILPGSSIHWVHADSRRDYARVAALAGGVVERAVASVAAEVDTASSVCPVVVFNAGSHEAVEVVELDTTALGVDSCPALAVDHAGQASAVQDLGGGRFAFLACAPGCGWARYDLLPSSPTPHASGAQSSPEVRHAARLVQGDVSGSWVLDNGVLRVEVDGDGLLTSVYDLDAGREVLAPGQRGNLMQLHHDLPNEYDAWDIDRSYLDSVRDLVDGVESVEAVELGPVRVSLRITRRFASSSITQLVRLAWGSRRLEFVTDVDWQERHQLLKVAFPVAIRSEQATYDIQFGYVKRPTHANTSWDEARFEVSAHRWAHLGEAGYGVALVNDCKYGHDIHGNVMRLTLLRGPGWPDPEADRGQHRFRYALHPHGGDLFEAGIIEEGEAFNLGLRVVPTGVHDGSRPPRQSLVALGRRGVMLSALKRADREDAVVVRLWEAWGGRGPHRLRTAPQLAPLRATRTDLLERDRHVVEVTAADGQAGVDMDLRPFELVTLKLHQSSASG